MNSDEPSIRLGAVYRVRVTPADVGRRVTVRYLVTEDDGPRPTDVVGTLESWTADVLRIRRRNDEVVEVVAGTVVASKVIPDPPVRRSPRE